MTEDTLLYERHTDYISVLTFNRPQSLNALDLPTMEKFASVIDEIAQDDSCRVLILTGTGERAFSTGGDLNDLADKNSESDALNFITIMGDALLKMERLPFPVIAAINGYALGGGCEIALACDMRIVDEKARLGMVQMRMGVTPGWGAGQRLMRQIGYSRAMNVLLRGHVMHAPEIESLGLAINLVEAGTAYNHALTFARHIAQSPPETVRGIKQLLQAGLNHSYEDALTIEREIFPPLWAGEAHKEAVDKFLERQREYEAEKAKKNSNG
jgi:enoyl-CoA hydratase